ncbi:toxin-antitoxin system HicB family antitoxin [Actinomadura formosensis]|uniref:toxin-antitoxin system HicB family antitoxin n=1 Tax=Actinomadura formosensis TaxID=60706 RepID=UPI00082B14D1|nr:toxin-antitoxin system HicB family antitoxin [Actinomadura formosensis]
MDLMPYVENLRRELAVAAEAGGPDARALAERLTGALESAARLTLLEALSAAADEITRDLAPGSVDVRLRGGDPAFVVTPPEPSSEGPGGGRAETAPGTPPPAAEEGGTARMTLRLPEHLKLRVEEAAGRQGISVNAWLVRAISAAFEPGAGSRAADRPQQSQSGRDYTGWVR